jgi:ATP-binding cassette subfamily B protein
LLQKASTEISRSLRAIVRGLAVVRAAAGGWTLLWGGLLLLQGAIPAALVYCTKLAVDALSAGITGTAGAVPAGLWPPLVLIPLLWFAGQVLSSILARVRIIQAELVQDHIHSLIHTRALALDLAFFDSPDSFDVLHRARIDAVSQPLALLESLGSLVQNGVTLVALAAMLATYALWLPLLLLATALPGLWVMGRNILREHRWRLQNTPLERRARYYDFLLTEQKAAAELRLFAAGDHFHRAFGELRARIRAGRLDLARKEMRAELAAGTIAWAGGMAGLAWMLTRALGGLARLGDLVLCYQSFQQGQKLLRSLFESAGRIYRSTLFLECLFEFLAIRPAVTAPDEPRSPGERVRDAIRFENVGFTYPGSDRPALHDFSLTLPAGKITAIVGHNGAGKSTLIKLLCRYYDPSGGRITFDGTDLREIAPEELRTAMTVLFQEPVHYHTSVAENIALGDLASPPDPARLNRAAADAGADLPIDRLPKGYNTPLGKHFGGAELSVGEWQRIALARAFYRDAPVVILDEPTSAMDSWAENRWISRFREVSAGKTVLIITHRFTTAMHADVIQVMDGGVITEVGTHRELVERGGHYAASWREQMKDLTTGPGLP